MVTLCRKFSITSSPSHYIPKQIPQLHKPTPPVSLPFTEQRAHLETQLFSALNTYPSVSHAKQIHAQIISRGLHFSSFLVTKLLRVLTRLGVPVDPYPRALFDWVEHPNPFLYNALIQGYLNEGKLSGGVEVYGFMRGRGARPLTFTFSALFKACGVAGDVFLGRQLHGQVVVVSGFGFDLLVENGMMDMYVKCRYLGSARKVFDEMSERDVASWTGLIVACAKVGDMVSAKELFEDLLERDMVAWTAMLTGFVMNAKPREAIEVFMRMQDLGVDADEVTLSGVISACAQLGLDKYMNWIHGVVERSSHRDCYGLLIGSALIDMYSKCGNVDVAYEIFEGMKERNVYSYSSMILGFAVHGRAHDSMKLFHEMVNADIKPNDVTFIGVLTACSHTGMVEQGQQLFESMGRCHGVQPTADHYTCLVDMLGRVGRLEEALKIVETMPVKPHAGVWGALLGACHIHGNPDIANIAASHLFELEPDVAGNYILLCNMYASAGRWHNISRVRKLMRTKSLKKNPGYSLFETKNGQIHEFYAGDMTHPRSREIGRALEDLLIRLEAIGYRSKLKYVPYDVSDEEKRGILRTHSEKLALAFGLLATDPGCTVKIVKNLRICEDCHLFMSFATQLTGREIVVRDKLRFHHFRNGACTCNNFW